MRHFYGNGKLLLSGEYAILDGATGLALPCRFGQAMEIVPQKEPFIDWHSLDHLGQTWFKSRVALSAISETPENPLENRLRQLLGTAQKLNPKFLEGGNGYIVRTTLDFPKDWGLGSSSTLVHTMAQWAEIDPYQLLEQTFGGSGYDIACAAAEGPILYKKEQGHPHITPTAFAPPFTDSLYFVYLNQKQNSREGIRQYRNIGKGKENLIRSLSALTQELVTVTTIDHFCKLLEEHEKQLSSFLKIPTVKQRLFANFPGTLKSLGAWGGDFILAVGDENTPIYFKEKGYETVVPYPRMIL